MFLLEIKKENEKYSFNWNPKFLRHNQLFFYFSNSVSNFSKYVVTPWNAQNEVVLMRAPAWIIHSYKNTTWATTCDFQQCGILTSVDSGEPVQPTFKLRKSKLCSDSSLTIIE